VIDRLQTIEQHRSLIKDVKNLVREEAKNISNHYPSAETVRGAEIIRASLAENQKRYADWTSEEIAAVHLFGEFKIINTGDPQTVWAGKNPSNWYKPVKEGQYLSKNGEVVWVSNYDLEAQCLGAPPQSADEVIPDELLSKYKDFTFQSDEERQSTIDRWYQQAAIVQKLMNS
jgi:hypothetical protein